MNPLKNQEGSTLMVVVFFIFILGIMGMTIITTTFAHMRTQRSQEERKYAFYASEAGIENTISALTGRAWELHLEAAEEAGVLLEDEKTKQRVLYEAEMFNISDVYGAPDYDINSLFAGYRTSFGTGGLYTPEEFVDISSFTDFVTSGKYLYEGSANGVMNQRNADVALENVHGRLFKQKYADYLSSSYTVYPPDVPLDFGFSDAPVIGIIAPADDAFTFSGDSITFKLFSSYFDENVASARKLLTVDITVDVPEYAPLMLDQHVKKFDPNILWTKALTAEKDLIVNSGNVEVFGNVYAFGDTPHSIFDPDLYRHGILVGESAAAALTVRGEAVTHKDVRFGTSGSALTVEGNLYARDFKIENGLSDIAVSVESMDTIAFDPYTVYNNVDMDGYVTPKTEPNLGDAGNLVLKNNLEFFGENSSIGISADYIGFSPPPPEDVAISGTDLTQTSCIIIGETAIENAAAHTSASNKISILGDMIICGIAYLLEPIDPDYPVIGTPFRTGESVAVSDNYNVYRNLLVDFGSDDVNFFQKFIDDFIGNHTDLTEALLADESLMEYEIPNGLGIFVPMYYDSIKLKTLDYTDYFYNVVEMIEFFISYYPNPEDFPEIITNVYTSGSSILDVGGNYYGYGIAFDENGIIRNDDIEEVDYKQIPARQMFTGQLNTFGDLLSDDFFTPVSDESCNLNTLLSTFGGSFNEELAEGEHVIVNTSGVTIDSAYADANGVVKGVIVTSGDVVINGPPSGAPLELRGTVVARGNIVVNGNVRIVNDPSFIAKAMYYCEANLPFIPSSITLTPGGDPAILPTYSFKTFAGSTEPITKEDFVYANYPIGDADSGINEKYNTIKGLISTSGWKVEEY